MHKYCPFLGQLLDYTVVSHHNEHKSTVSLREDTIFSHLPTTGYLAQIWFLFISFMMFCFGSSKKQFQSVVQNYHCTAHSIQQKESLSTKFPSKMYYLSENTSINECLCIFSMWWPTVNLFFSSVYLVPVMINVLLNFPSSAVHPLMVRTDPSFRSNKLNMTRSLICIQ